MSTLAAMRSPGGVFRRSPGGVRGRGDYMPPYAIEAEFQDEQRRLVYFGATGSGTEKTSSGLKARAPEPTIWWSYTDEFQLVRGYDPTEEWTAAWHNVTKRTGSGTNKMYVPSELTDTWFDVALDKTKITSVLGAIEVGSAMTYLDKYARKIYDVEEEYYAHLGGIGVLETRAKINVNAPTGKGRVKLNLRLICFSSGAAAQPGSLSSGYGFQSGGFYQNGPYDSVTLKINGKETDYSVPRTNNPDSAPANEHQDISIEAILPNGLSDIEITGVLTDKYTGVSGCVKKDTLLDPGLGTYSDAFSVAVEGNIWRKVTDWPPYVPVSYAAPPSFPDMLTDEDNPYILGSRTNTCYYPKREGSVSCQLSIIETT